MAPPGGTHAGARRDVQNSVTVDQSGKSWPPTCGTRRGRGAVDFEQNGPRGANEKTGVARALRVFRLGIGTPSPPLITFIGHNDDARYLFRANRENRAAAPPWPSRGRQSAELWNAVTGERRVFARAYEETQKLGRRVRTVDFARAVRWFVGFGEHRRNPSIPPRKTTISALILIQDVSYGWGGNTSTRKWADSPQRSVFDSLVALARPRGAGH